jgi:phosphate transport system protein
VRELFHGELEQIGSELTGLCGLVCLTMEQASRAVLDTDLACAERAITTHDEVNQRGEQCEERACALLALQAPVARDLRLVVTAIRASEKISRMGDLAAHIAEIARLRHPRPAVPAELHGRFERMSELALKACRHVQQTIGAPADVSLPALEKVDDEIDRLHREVLDLVGRADPPHPVQFGVDVALLARYFERFGDQAVSVTRHIDYVITGDLARPEPLSVRWGS